MADLSSAPEVSFSNATSPNVNLLIGPNGSGKSNFLTIGYHIFKSAFLKQYTVDQSCLDSTLADEQAQAIREYVQPFDHVFSHVAFQDQPSEVLVSLTLTQHDYDNLRFLLSHREYLHRLIDQYSRLEIAFDVVNIDDLVLADSTYTFHCSFDVASGFINVTRDGLSSLERFVLDYLLYKQLIQICIVLHNRLVDDDPWKALFTTVGFLGFERSFEWLPTSLTPRMWEDMYLTPHDHTSHQYDGYFLCAKKIWDILARDKKELSIDQAMNDLAGSEFFVSLASLIHKYFAKNLKVALHDWTLDFFLDDEEGHHYSFSDLWDGEQSLLFIILAIYGYDLKEGLLVIDEPEMHFHPQMQRSLSAFMERISRNIGTQFIVSTYSPLFIDETNITHVYRFAKPHLSTLIKNPDVDFSTDEASLVHLLKFENLSKIFFVNRIIMVEGETDAYFFDFYFKYLHTLPEWKDVLTDYEIININGKWSYHLWKKFLARFGISSFFIGDWDNIVDYGFMSQTELTYYYKQAKHFRPDPAKFSIAKGSHYNKLVLAMKQLFPKKYEEVQWHIDTLYRQQVFVLKKGDIETYLWLKEKGLESTVHFCHHEFGAWLANKQFDAYRNEFHEVLVHIFS